jgi:hypothetical protein
MGSKPEQRIHDVMEHLTVLTNASLEDIRQACASSSTRTSTSSPTGSLQSMPET